MAGLLAVAFTTALSGGRDPNYVLQPHRDEPTEVAAGVDCEQLDLVHQLLAQTERSSEDWQFRRVLSRARRILGCDA